MDIDTTLKLIGALIAAIGGLWALIKYIIEKGSVAAAELKIECEVLSEKGEQKIVELTVNIFNAGASILVAEKISMKLKTLSLGDRLLLYDDIKKFGRLIFPHSVAKKCGPDKNDGFFLLVPYSTFVHPGVNQKYSFITVVDQSTDFLHAHVKITFPQRGQGIRNAILHVSRRIGLIQYSLSHIYEPSSIQKGFKV